MTEISFTFLDKLRLFFGQKIYIYFSPYPTYLKNLHGNGFYKTYRVNIYGVLFGIVKGNLFKWGLFNLNEHT